MLGMLQHTVGNTRQSCHLNSVTAARRASLYFMQKHNAVVATAGRRLCCADMHVHSVSVFDGKLSQLKIMGGKQSERLRFVMQMRSNTACQSQSVKSGCATTNFIHQYQAVCGGVMQDMRSFRHFQHEGRLRVG